MSPVEACEPELEQGSSVPRGQSLPSFLEARNSLCSALNRAPILEGLLILVVLIMPDLLELVHRRPSNLWMLQVIKGRLQLHWHLAAVEVRWQVAHLRAHSLKVYS